MQTWPAESVDVIITSPPYNLAGLQGRIKKGGKSDLWKNRAIEYDGDPLGDFLPEDRYQNWQIEILNEFHRILKRDGSIFYNHQVRVHEHKAIHPLEWILKSKCNFRQEIIWNRKGGMNKYPIRFIPSTQLILWLTKSNVQPRFTRPDSLKFESEVWTLPPEKEPLHPAPFPDEIPENIIRCVPGNDVVILDPFNGIGHTTAMAKKYGKMYIGIDKSPKYCELARRRLEQIQPQLPIDTYAK